jgi:Rrf2 family protein
VKAGLLQGKRGQNGGYRLNKEPNKITIVDIVYASCNPIKLKDCGEMNCLQSVCIGNYLWAGMELQSEKYLSKITLADVISEK